MSPGFSSPVTATVTLYEGGANPTAGTNIGTAQNSSISSEAYYGFTYSNISMRTGNTYYFVITSNDGIGVHSNTNGGYNNGTGWGYDDPVPTRLGWWDTVNPYSGISVLGDLTFQITTCN